MHGSGIWAWLHISYISLNGLYSTVPHVQITQALSIYIKCQHTPKPCPFSPIWRELFHFLNPMRLVWGSLWLPLDFSLTQRTFMVMPDPLISSPENKPWKTDECETHVAATCAFPSLSSDAFIFFNGNVKSLEFLSHTWGETPYQSPLYLGSFWSLCSFHSPLPPTLLLLKPLSLSLLHISDSLVVSSFFCTQNSMGNISLFCLITLHILLWGYGV